MRLFKKTAALVMGFMMLVTAMSSFTLASAPNQPEIVVEADGIVKATTTWNKNIATVTTDKETYTITYGYCCYAYKQVFRWRNIINP